MPIDFTEYEGAHYKRLSDYEKQITKLYTDASTQVGLLANGVQLGDVPFILKKHPALKKRFEKIVKELYSGIEAITLNGIEEEWLQSNKKNDDLVNAYLPQAAIAKRYFTTNELAKKAFKGRKIDGLNLSQRIWKTQGQFKEEMEMALDIGIREGKSAAKISQDIRQYLQEPNKLFRRVRDQHGNFQLSKNAKAFSPGQGVYRSSYKNARRVTVTETNMAYRTADSERWDSLDFVIGIEVKLSNNHTLNGIPFTDICDTLKGKYPKDFVFKGWHPHCRCYQIPILQSEEDFIAGKSAEMLEDIPSNFKGWLKDNKKRIDKAKTMPYFLSDNKALLK